MRWRKSRYSGGEGTNCVELGRDDSADLVVVRDSKNATGSSLTVRLSPLIAAAKAGVLDLS